MCFNKPFDTGKIWGPSVNSHAISMVILWDTGTLLTYWCPSPNSALLLLSKNPNPCLQIKHFKKQNYLKNRHAERPCCRERFLILWFTPQGLGDWGRPKLGAWNLFRVSRSGGRDPRACVIYCLPRVHMSRKLELEMNSSVGCEHPREWFISGLVFLKYSLTEYGKCWGKC